jgi:hypothetical protein
LIAILAILEFIVGLVLVLGGALLLTGVLSVSELEPELQNLGSAGGVALIVVGIIYLIIAGGFWNGWKIMWYIGLIVTVISIILEIAGLITGGFSGITIGVIVPLIIDLLILFYLSRPGVREFFGV